MTTVNTIAFLVCVAVTTSFACMHNGGGNRPRPSCDEGQRCPEYEVAERNRGFELRRYKPAMWVGTTVLGMDYREAGSEGFNRLFGYISGENEQNMKIDMTAPVVTRVMPNEDWSGFRRNFTIYFYVSSEYLGDGAPRPTNRDVFITRVPGVELYAREFSGYATSDMYLEEATTLMDLLREAEAPFACDHFAAAGYDHPMKPFNRRNEVWFPKISDDNEEMRMDRCRAGPRE